MDVVIANARVVRPSGVTDQTLGIEDGRIALLGGTSDVPAAARTVDARGLLVLPGLVDPHVHMREPGAPHKEDFASGTRAAAAGGFTTVLCMPNVTPPVVDERGFEASVVAGGRSAVVDFGLQAVAGPGSLDAIPALWRRGVTSFEIFMADAPDPLRLEGSADLYEAFRMVHRCGGIAGAFCGEQSLVAHELNRLRGAGRKDWGVPGEARPALSEVLGITRALILAEAAGARLYVRQVSTGEGMRAVREGKTRRPGQVFAEVTPHHLFLTADATRRHGAFAHMLPPLQSSDQVAALWEGLAQGWIDAIGSDHAPHALAEKQAARDDPWAAPSGTPGLETTLPLLLDAANAGRIALPRVVDLCAERPARIFGLYPRKGALAVGSDADLVLVDPERKTVIEADHLYTRARSSPFEGARLRGAPVMTIVRGHVVMTDGRIVDAPPPGIFVPGPGHAHHGT